MANIFPKWVNSVPIKVIIAILLIKSAVVIGITYYFSPQYTRVGYAPTQPVAFSHEFHAGTLEIDCRYCHTFVEQSGHSNVPGTNVCMSCHSMVLKDDADLLRYDKVTTQVNQYLGFAFIKCLTMYILITQFT